MKHRKAGERGFTLLELVIVVVIFGILTALLVNGFPAVREKQRLLLAEQEFQSLLRDAQRRALNEERDEDCLTQVADPPRCSNVGLHFDGNNVVMFADISNDTTFDSGSDYLITPATSLPTGVTTPAPRTLVFRAVPPDITLFVDGNETTTAALTFVSGRFTSAVSFNRYGVTER